MSTDSCHIPLSSQRKKEPPTSTKWPLKSINKRSRPALDNYVALHCLCLGYCSASHAHTWPDYCSKKRKLFLDCSLLFALFLALSDRIARKTVDVRHI